MYVLGEFIGVGLHQMRQPAALFGLADPRALRIGPAGERLLTFFEKMR